MEFVAKELDGFIVVADNQSHVDDGLFHIEDTLSMPEVANLTWLSIIL